MTAYRHSETTRRVLRSLVPVICPPEAEAIADAIVDHMALTIGVAPFLVQKAFGAGAATYDLGALPRYRKRAHKLTGDAADAYYDSWVHGITPVHKQFATALNQIMSLSCYEQPLMMDAIGYRVAPYIEEKRKHRLAVFADEIKQREIDILAPDPLRPVAKKEVA